jgi:hypothetical protein
MTLLRNTLVIVTAISSFTLVMDAPASARTVCRPDGLCFNTSGRPIPYYDQPAFQGYTAYGDRRSYPYHHRRHWHHDDYDD